jgi:hypothetical protein
MDITEYRKEFAAYNSALELAHFNHRAGYTANLDLEPVYDRYSDLFSHASIESLADLLKETPETRQTEIAALRSLLASAQIASAEFQAREIAAEKSECEAAPSVEWMGQRLRTAAVSSLLSNENDSIRRRELFARYTDAVDGCNDLRADLLASIHSHIRDISGLSYKQFFSQVMKTDLGKLASAAAAFLAQTESAYESALDAEISRSHLGVEIADLSHADFLRIQRMQRFDRFFPSTDLLPTYSRAMRLMGIRADEQRNLHFDVDPRAGKNPRAACFRVNIPDDIRISVAPIGGSYDYTVLFHEAGHAQHFSWTSREISARYPEFVFTPENATGEAFAFLFTNLYQDRRWVSEIFRSLSPERVDDVSRAQALLTFCSVRRYCAKLQYESVLHESNELGSEALAHTYSQIQKSFTFFTRPPSMYLLDVEDDFYCAAYVRAWWFEAALREHLKTKYGLSWWNSKKALDDLIDLWNTGSRYSVEELAQSFGLGSFDLGIVAEALITSVKED